MVYSKTTQAIVAGLIAIAFLFVPMLPTSILYATDNLIVRFLLLASLLGSIYFSPLVSIVTFLLVARIFIERNNEKLHRAKAFVNTSVPAGTNDPIIDSTGDIKDDQAHVDRTVHSDGHDELSYMPHDEIGSDEFGWNGSSSVGDYKHTLQGVTEGEQAANTVFTDVRPENTTNAF
uniref:Uncharacterized protein n=1 Tax=viral metagenome TaxID=1070528 RepID=A0A6C0IA19_9ZZZZ